MIKRTLSYVLLIIILSGTMSFANAPLIFSADDAEILALFNSADAYQQLQQLGEMYFDTIFISQDVQETYNMLTAEGRQTVWKRLLGNRYSDIKGLQNAVYIVAVSIYRIEKTESKSGGSSPSGGGSSAIYNPAQGGYINERIPYDPFLEASDTLTKLGGTVYFEEEFEEDINVTVMIGSLQTTVTLLKGTNSIEYELDLYYSNGFVVLKAVLDVDEPGYRNEWYCLDGTAVREIMIDGSGTAITDADIYIKKPRKISGNLHLPESFWETITDNIVEMHVYVQSCAAPYYYLGNLVKAFHRDENETIFNFDFYLSDFNEDEFIIFYSLYYENDAENAEISPYGYYKANGETGLLLDDNVRLPATSYEDIDFNVANFIYSDEWGITLLPSPFSVYSVIAEVAQKNTDNPPTLVFAVYVNGILVDMKNFNVNTKTVRYSFYYEHLFNPHYLSDDELENAKCRVKVFMWNSLGGLTPICESAVVSFEK